MRVARMIWYAGTMLTALAMLAVSATAAAQQQRRTRHARTGAAAADSSGRSGAKPRISIGSGGSRRSRTRRPKRSRMPSSMPATRTRSSAAATLSRPACWRITSARSTPTSRPRRSCRGCSAARAWGRHSRALASPLLKRSERGGLPIARRKTPRSVSRTETSVLADNQEKKASRSLGATRTKGSGKSGRPLKRSGAHRAGGSLELPAFLHDRSGVPRS